jgi:hypothetical protein
MVWLAVVGILFEFAGFVLMIKSTTRLDRIRGDFVSDRYADPRTGEPPPHIESSPNPLIYRPGIYSIMIGLGFQVADILFTQAILQLPL